MEKAIKRAIDGGYDFKGFLKKPLATYEVGKMGERYEHKDLYTVYFAKRNGVSFGRDSHEFWDEQIILDPLFWQALGKAEKWDEDSGVVFNHKFNGYKKDLIPARFYPTQNSWQYHLHSFIDHISDNGDIDDFFNELISDEHAVECECTECKDARDTQESDDYDARTCHQQ